MKRTDCYCNRFFYNTHGSLSHRTVFLGTLWQYQSHLCILAPRKKTPVPHYQTLSKASLHSLHCKMKPFPQRRQISTELFHHHSAFLDTRNVTARWLPFLDTRNVTARGDPSLSSYAIVFKYTYESVNVCLPQVQGPSDIKSYFFVTIGHEGK